MTVDILELKRLNRIEDVVDEFEEFKLARRARSTSWKGEVHDSFVVQVDKQLYFWNSRGRGGDVISFLEQECNMEFRQALEWLAKRVGMTLHMDEQQAAAVQARRARADALTVIMEFLEGKLAASAAAMAYTEGRGWTAATVREARLGFWDGDKKGLAKHLAQHEIDAGSDVAQAVMGMPAGMLIYGHWRGNTCEYVSGRGIEGKRHFNPRGALLGERRPYWNHKVTHMDVHLVVVEGQADAVTLGQWGIPAVALAGTSANEELLNALGKFMAVYVALDADEAGQGNAGELAAHLGAMTRIVTWPGEGEILRSEDSAQNDGEEGETTEVVTTRIKDANDWLVAGGTSEECRELLAGAPNYAVWLCQRVAAAAPLQREAALDRAVATVARLPEYAYEKAKRGCADLLNLQVRELNGMVRALKKDSSNGAYKQELETANGYLDGHLFELVFDPEHESGPWTAFAVRYPDGRIGIARSIETENYRILPMPPWDSILNRGFIKCPTGLGSYGTEVELQQEIQAFIHKYVDVPEHIEVMASYYVMMTWLFDIFYVLPYLRARGDSDSGKSRFTETVGHLCFRPMMITGSTTPSPVFRLIQQWNGLTVVMDEADLPYSETSADWTQMLNTGYKKGSGILRTAMINGEARVEGFTAFGPKVLNMRGRFPDDATESRCLTWETSSGRGIRDDIPRYMDRDEFEEEALQIRNKLLRWRLQTFTKVEINYNQEDTKHLPGRLVEITVSLMSISDSDEFKNQVMSFIAKMNQRSIMQRQLTLPAKVMEGILRAKWLPDGQARAGHDKDRMQVAHITRQTNRTLNRENEEASLQDVDDPEEGYKPKGEVSWQKVSWIMRDVLNLETQRAGSPKNPYVLIWDEARIDALVRRYGYEDLMVELIEKGMEADKEAAEKADKEGKQAEMKL